MSEKRITYEDVKEYENLFSLIPPLLLKRFARKNTNLVLKFQTQIKKYLSELSDNQKNKLEILLNTEIDELQSLMEEAYQKSNKKQYKIFANPKNRQFIENNLNELHKLFD